MVNIMDIIKNDQRYYNIVKDILNNPEFLKRKTYMHHNDRNVYDHSLMVSYKAYRLARKLGLDYREVAIGGLLHDFYTTPWMENKEKKPFFKQHGFTHAKEAYNNTVKYFGYLVNDKIKDIIVRHMFPLNPTPPKYLESWIVSFADKYVSLEIFKEPKKLYRYIGIMDKENKI